MMEVWDPPGVDSGRTPAVVSHWPAGISAKEKESMAVMTEVLVMVVNSDSVVIID